MNARANRTGRAAGSYCTAAVSSQHISDRWRCIALDPVKALFWPYQTRTLASNAHVLSGDHRSPVLGWQVASGRSLLAACVVARRSHFSNHRVSCGLHSQTFVAMCMGWKQRFTNHAGYSLCLTHACHRAFSELANNMA